MTGSPLSATMEMTDATTTQPADIYVFPLSYAQRRLWFVHQLDPASPAYNVPLNLRMTGRLDVPAFTAALNELVRRHEILRTTFPMRDGEPVQEIHPPRPLMIPCIDVSGLEKTDQEYLAAQLRQEERDRCFDFENGPLLRHRFMQLADQQWEFQLVIHHILTDGWSDGILIAELQTLYEAYRDHRFSPLPDLPIQYADYALWQREWLKGEVLERQIQYWRQKLDGLAALDLPNDYPRKQELAHPGEHLYFQFDRELSEKLKELCQSNGATLFMALLAGLQVLLGKYARQQDIAVGVSIANRGLKETETVIGLFVNTLIMRVNMGGRPTFREVLDRVRCVALEAYEHQDVPFEKLVEELNPERGVGELPLVQVLLAFQNMPAVQPKLGGLEVRRMASDARYSLMDLCVAIADEADGLAVRLAYATDLYSRKTMQRFAEHYERVLRCMAAAPDQPIEEISLLGDDERRQLLSSQSSVEIDPSQGSLVIKDLFERQAGQTPDATAVVYGDDEISYRDLDERSNQLGRYLQSLGVGPEVRVGICVEPGFDIAVGILGVIKAGGVYIPLDPTYPAERLQYLWRDSEAGFLLAQSYLESKLPAQGVLLDREWNKISRQSRERLQTSVTGFNLANIIYTSGSTGTPKGVGVPQIALANRSRFLAKEYQMQTSDRLLQFLSFGFDAFGEEFFPILTSGGTLVIEKGVKSLGPAQMLSLLERQKITILHMPFAFWSELRREALKPGSFVPDTVRLLITGGEAIPRDEGQEWVATTGIALSNAYGPTEATITATIYNLPRPKCNHDDARGTSSLPIGAPIPGTRLYVLDDAQQLVSSGLAGELYLAGENLARGYLKQPALTAERFLPDPFAASGARMYRTGDLVRWHGAECLEFLGRTDQQVKIRGYRVELGEIETVLRQEPEVQQCVVAVREDAIRSKYLVAYVVGTSGGQLKVNELRRKLHSKLPEYMVPTVFLELEKLPTTANGKVDRQGLPAPEFGNSETFAPARTPLEQIIAGTWMDVLGLEQLSIHDNFFDLGGHSMLATQAIARLHKSLGKSIPLVAIFEEPTVARLAARIEMLEGALVPPVIERRHSGALVPLSFSQERLWLADQMAHGSPAYNGPLVLRFRGKLQIEILSAVFDEIVRRHEVLRTSFPTLDERPYQSISPAKSGILRRIDLSKQPEELREALLEELLHTDVRLTFDLAKDHPLRVSLYHLSELDNVLCIVIHHIAFDAWSLANLQRELVATYTAFLSGAPSPFPELPLQYADVALWEHNWLQGNVLDRHLKYWRQRLEDCTQVAELPADFPRSESRSFQAGIRRTNFSQDLLQAIRLLGRHQGATDFMVLLAIINVWLRYHTEQQDIVIGTPISNRNQVETEALIGFFINTLALRNHVGDEIPFAAFLDQVVKSTLQDYAHQGLPFERLVHELRIKHDSNRNPLFQVMFNMESIPGTAPQPGRTADPEIAGLEVESLGSGLLQSRFDLHLNLHVVESGIEIACTYSNELFRSSTIDSLMATLGATAQFAVEGPQKRISEILAHIAQFERQEGRELRQERNQMQLQGLHVVRRRSLSVDAPSEVL
ncbi:MAG TPA: amino acid adenylation domain-containing protein [Candidatus Angelobacter sp.]|nr:amino acid adenylation domain-containing protein [Candidatus Angelobacter sp.]